MFLYFCVKKRKKRENKKILNFFLLYAAILCHFCDLYENEYVEESMNSDKNIVVHIKLFRILCQKNMKHNHIYTYTHTLRLLSMFPYIWQYVYKFFVYIEMK